MLPIYIPRKRAHTDRLHLAVWNCGKRPQTFFQKLGAIRITVRKNNRPIITIKKGEI